MSEWDSWDIWDGEFTAPARHVHMISLCTTCMDRAFTLKQVLPTNLRDNADYPALEWVLLDYNSRDDLGDWVRAEMMPHIESGVLRYYRTAEPEHYSMTHSRNVAFRLARGDIVNNVDADNFTGPGFADYVNRLANERPRRAVFAKGKRLLHGRIGFFKDEFLDILGGYDEDIEDYGHDDKDLLHRAMALGFRLMWYGGRFVRRIKTPRSLVGQNMKNPNWRATELRNKEISVAKLSEGRYKANVGTHWGKATLVLNFEREIKV